MQPQNGESKAFQGPWPKRSHRLGFKTTLRTKVFQLGLAQNHPSAIRFGCHAHSVSQPQNSNINSMIEIPGELEGIEIEIEIEGGTEAIANDLSKAFNGEGTGFKALG
jgi:hypothetical protein